MKIISLLFLLLLTSTSCLAGCSAMGNFGPAILMMMGTAFLVYSIINLILTTCFYRLILKDKTTPLKMLLKAATLSLFFWSLPVFLLIFIDIQMAFSPLHFVAITIRDYFFATMIILGIIIVVTAMPIYRLLFLRKK